MQFQINPVSLFDIKSADSLYPHSYSICFVSDDHFSPMKIAPSPTFMDGSRAVELMTIRLHDIEVISKIYRPDRDGGSFTKTHMIRPVDYFNFRKWMPKTIENLVAEGYQWIYGFELWLDEDADGNFMSGMSTRVA